MARNLPGILAINVGLTLAAILILALLISPLALTLPWLLRTKNFAFGGEDFSWCFATDINADRLPNRRSACASASCRKRLRTRPSSTISTTSIRSRGACRRKDLELGRCRPPHRDRYEDAISRTIRIALVVLIVAAVVLSAVRLSIIG